MLLKSDPYLCLSQIALYAPKHDIKFLAVQYSKTEIAEEKNGLYVLSLACGRISKLKRTPTLAQTRKCISLFCCCAASYIGTLQYFISLVLSSII